MKTLLLFATLLAATNGFAGSVECISENYKIVVENLDDVMTANYAIGGNLNDGAEVFLEQKLLSERLLALTLNVDGQSAKFEVTATRSAPGVFKGMILMGDRSEGAVCTVTL